MNKLFTKIISEYEEISVTLGQESSLDRIKLAQRFSELGPVVSKIKEVANLERAIKDNDAIISAGDSELVELAIEENSQLKEKLESLNTQIELELIPKDDRDGKNIIIEIRAGAGGDESTIFAAEMFRAYTKLAEKHGFITHTLSHSRSEASGFKEVIFEVNSKRQVLNGPFYYFKYESGVHRVQRVPETEKSGRVHTSTITVAVLPELEAQEFQIDQKDLKIEATTSSGHGGQSVNTTYSAIRITHLPTGITAQCQDERSQTQNKEKALAVIRARVAQHYREIEEKKLINERRSQIGSGDRSEKIRTYNFPQDRVTDHRINENFNQINLVMEGELDKLIDSLHRAELELRKEDLGLDKE